MIGIVCLLTFFSASLSAMDISYIKNDRQLWCGNRMVLELSRKLGQTSWLGKIKQYAVYNNGYVAQIDYMAHVCNPEVLAIYFLVARGDTVNKIKIADSSTGQQKIPTITELDISNHAISYKADGKKIIRQI